MQEFLFFSLSKLACLFVILITIIILIILDYDCLLWLFVYFFSRRPAVSDDSWAPRKIRWAINASPERRFAFIKISLIQQVQMENILVLVEKRANIENLCLYYNCYFWR